MNPFEEFVEGSNPIHDGLSAIVAKENKRTENASSYIASMDSLREEMKAMEEAFKDVVYGYSAILPSGWRAIGDFDEWVAGKACAGFVRGGLNPTDKLMIGGNSETVKEIELELERLYAYLVKFS
jgi:hypothetical protein